MILNIQSRLPFLFFFILLDSHTLVTETSKQNNDKNKVKRKSKVITLPIITSNYERQIYHRGILLQTIYQTWSIFKLFAKGVCFCRGAVGSNGEIAVPPSPMARQLTWRGCRCCHWRDTPREEGLASPIGETPCRPAGV